MTNTVPALVAEFRAIMSAPMGGVPTSEQARAVIEFKASTLPACPDLWAIYHVPHDSDVGTLCEFDGSICYECYRDAMSAQRSASRLNADGYSESGRYMVGRLPAGVAGNPCDNPTGESQSYRSTGPDMAWTAGMQHGYTTCAVSVADLTAPADQAIAAIEAGLIEGGAIERAADEAPADVYNRLVNIVRAIDGYDWRNMIGPIELDAFLARIRREAMAGCADIKAAVDRADAAPLAVVPQQAQQQQASAGTTDPDYPRALAYERTREVSEGELTYATPDVLTACVGRALAAGWSFDQAAAEAGEWPWFLHMTFDEGRCVRRNGGWRLYVETAAEALAEAGEADHVALITAGPAA